MAKTINLTDKNDNKTGTDVDEIIYGKGGNDTINGGGGNDKLDGGSQNDRLIGGKGNDTIIGGEGNDTAVFSGLLEDDNGDPLYGFDTDANNNLIVTDLRSNGTDGVDRVSSVEFLKFQDETIDVADILKEINRTPLPTLSFDPPTWSIKEGTAGDGFTELTLNLQLSEPSDNPVTVHVSSAQGSATPGSDYLQLEEDVSFLPGETEQSVTVSIATDAVKEGNETFYVKLSNAEGAELEGDGKATITILDDDSGNSPPTTGIKVGDVKISEGNAGSKSVTATVTLSGSYTNKVTVDYNTVDGTATAGSDYVGKSGTLTFNPGVTTQNVTITIKGETMPESDETFLLSLSNPKGAPIVDGKGVITIANDDGAVQPFSGDMPEIGVAGVSALSLADFSVG